jgi:PST family polysaccharide transporter
LIGVIVFIAAPFLGDFFAHPEIVSLTRVLALSLVIGGFENVGVVLFQKEMRFNRQFFLNMSTVLFEVVTVIVAGFILRNAWALVIGSIANRSATVLFSYLFHPYRPKFAPKLTHVRHLLRYGKWISIGAVVSYFVTQGDNFSVGKIIGPEGLGFYQAAFALALLPVAEFGRVLGNALFPAFAKLEIERREEAFTRVSQLIFTLTIPASLGIYVLAPDIVRIFYGARWMPMAPIVSVLALYALIRSFEAVGAPFFMGIGKPKITTIALFAQCETMAILLPIFLINMSTVGAAWAMFVSGVVSASVYIIALYREKLFALRGIARLVIAPLIAGVGMVYVLRGILAVLPIGNLFGLFFAVGFGAIAYLLFLWCVDVPSGGKIFAHLRWVRVRVFPHYDKLG